LALQVSDRDAASVVTERSIDPTPASESALHNRGTV
jgi:hypothetical protein